MHEDDVKLRLQLQEKTKEANALRAKLRNNDRHLRGTIRQLEKILDEAGIDWRERLTDAD